MRTRSYFAVAFLLLLAAILLGTVVFRYTADPRDPDAMGAVLTCLAVPIFGLGIVFGLVGFARLIDDRAKKDRVKNRLLG